MTSGPTLIVIRERSFLDLLDLALLVVRDRPVILGLTALAGIGPCALFNAWLLSGDDTPKAFWIPLVLMEAPWATAPLTVVLGDLMFSVRLRPAKILRTLVASFPSLFFTQFLLRGLTYLLVIGIVLMPTRFAFFNEVALLERAGLGATLARSRVVCRGIESELFGRWLLQLALGATFAWCFQKGAETFGSVLAGGDVTWDQAALLDLSDLMFHAGVWLAIAYFAVVRFLCYIDRRIRLEGWEVELKLKSVGRALEERQT